MEIDIKPELKLWAAVMSQALQDLRAPQGQHKAIYQAQAKAWFESNNFGAGSFEWICHVLDLNPEPIRTQLGLRARVSIQRGIR